MSAPHARRSVPPLVGALAALGALACGGEPTHPPPVDQTALTALAIADETGAASDTLDETAQRTLRARGVTVGGAVRDAATPTWGSSDTNVVTLTTGSDGRAALDAVGPGRATVTVAAEGRRTTRTLTVLRAPAVAVSVERGDGTVSGLSPADADTLLVRASRSYRAVVIAPSGRPLRNRAATLTSSDTAVATIAPDGRVDGRAVGTASLTATAEGVVGTRVLRVRPPLAARIAFTYVPESLQVRRTDSVRAVLLDSAGRAIGVPPAVRTGVTATGATLVAGSVRAATPGSLELVASGDGLEMRRTLRVVALPLAPPLAYPATVATTAGRSLLLAARAVDVDGVGVDGAVRYASGDPAVAAVTDAGVVTARAPGATVIRVTTGTMSTDVPVEIAPASGFAFEVRPATVPLPPVVAAALAEAAGSWERAIVGDLPDVSLTLGAGQCDQTLAGPVDVDDIVVYAKLDSLDGRSGVLAQAGPCVLRADGRAAVGVIEIDSVDVAALAASGDLATVLRHELGHVLGIGTLWPREGFATRGAGGWRYRGPRGLAVARWWERVPDDGVGGVPLGGALFPDPGHWAEATFDNELMTPVLNRGANPLSLLTLEALADLRYQPTAAAAEAYARYPGVPAGGPAASRLPGWGFHAPDLAPGVAFDRVRAPRWRVGPAGGRAAPL